jgi:hypothetical protein
VVVVDVLYSGLTHWFLQNIVNQGRTNDSSIGPSSSNIVTIIRPRPTIITAVNSIGALKRYSYVVFVRVTDEPSPKVLVDPSCFVNR